MLRQAKIHASSSTRLFSITVHEFRWFIFHSLKKKNCASSVCVRACRCVVTINLHMKKNETLALNGDFINCQSLAHYEKRLKESDIILISEDI